MLEVALRSRKWIGTLFSCVFEDWLKMVRKVRANLARDVPMGAQLQDKVPPLRDLFINLWNLIVSAWQSFPHPDRNLLFFHVDLSGCWEIA